MRSGKNRAATAVGRQQLGARDRRIIDDIMRYRLTTNEFIQRRYLPQANINAAVKISGRLVRQGWLNAYPLYDKRQYFGVGPRLSKQFGISMYRTRPLGPQALATHVSIARYVFCSSTKSMRLVSPDELIEAFPWLGDRKLPAASILEQADGALVWRLVRVDLGGRPDHIARKCSAEIEPLKDCSEFQSVLEAGQFVNVVLTASRPKKQMIERALADHRWPTGIRFQIGIVPELLQLLSQA